MTERSYGKAGRRYYETSSGPDLQLLVLLRAQVVDARSLSEVAQWLSERFHVYSHDCSSHSESLRDPTLYNVRSLGEAVADFVKDVVGRRVWLLGHSSGCLVAAYVAA